MYVAPRYRRLYEKGIERLIDNPYKHLNPAYKDVCRMDSSTKESETMDFWGSHGLFETIHDNIDSLPIDEKKLLGYASVTHKTYGKELVFGYNAIKDDPTGSLKKYLRKSAGIIYLHEMTKEVEFADIFNTGFTTKTGSYNDEVIFQDSHEATAGTTSNILATAADLSQTSLQQMMLNIKKMTNDGNIAFAFEPEKLLTSADEYFTAQEILQTQYELDSNNNNVNVVKSNFNLKHIDCSQFTDSDAWFLTVKNPEQTGLIFYTREKLNQVTEDQPLKRRMITGYASRWSILLGDWRMLHGTPGA